MSQFITLESASQEAISDSFSPQFDVCEPSMSVEHGRSDLDNVNLLDEISDVYESWFDNFLEWEPSTESNDCFDNTQLLGVSGAGETIEQQLECFVQPSVKILDFGTTSLVHGLLPVTQIMPGEIVEHRSYLQNEPMRSDPDKKRRRSNKKDISLSESTAVGSLFRAEYKVEIVYPLEKTFRPRYKSDYFAQNGLKRKPRYVADRANNHFITIKVPTNVRGQIRVDWLTVPDADGKQYTMPYKFQADNESTNTPDCNPLYLDIDADAAGKMKLYLVLIKSKQDALKYQQPLKAFQPIFDSFHDQKKSKSEAFIPLTPKKLIEKYQLCKSVLAFTLCTWGDDGITRVIEWQTTVISTVLTEEKGAEDELKYHITCPKCSIDFAIDSIGDDEPGEQDKKRKKRRAAAPKTAKAENANKKRCTLQLITV